MGSQLKFDFRKGTSKGEKEIIIEIFAGKFTKRKKKILNAFMAVST